MKKKSKVKNELVFDNAQRELFLKGFSKRKKQRQQKAQKEIDLKLKEEKKRIKLEAKNLKETYKHSFKPIEELKESSDESSADEEFETDEVKVVVKSLDVLKKPIVKHESNDADEETKQKKKNKNDDSNCIKGMEIKGENDDQESETEEKSEDPKFTSKKELKRLINKQTKLAVKKSKILQRKNQLNHKRNIKMSQRKKYYKEKFLKKHKKIK